MKEKHKISCNALIMTFTSLKKYVYSKKCLKQQRQPPPLTYPSLQQSRRCFRAEKVTWLQLLFVSEYAYCDPADRVTTRPVYRSP